MPQLITKRYVFILVLMGIAALIAYRFMGTSGSRRPPMQTAPVRIATAIAQDVPQFLQGIGTVIPEADVLVTSRVTGELQTLYFTEGQRVRAGDILAQIDPRPFKAALAQAKGTLAQDEAELANARVDRNRYAGLVAKDYVARQTYDQQAAKVRQLEGTVAADRAKVEAAALDVTYSCITAPVSGRLGLRNVDAGTMITANDTTGIVRITEVTPSYVVFTLPEANIVLITQALKKAAAETNKSQSRHKVELWSRDQKEMLAIGELLTVDNRIDTSTGTVRLKAIFPNKDESLYPNEFVNARLLVRTLHNAVTVPPSAVQIGSSGTYVFVIDADNKAHRREVRTGVATQAVTVIETGLDAGEQVVVDGVDRLKEGTPVRVAATLETVLLTDRMPPLTDENALSTSKMKEPDTMKSGMEECGEAVSKGKGPRSNGQARPER